MTCKPTTSAKLPIIDPPGSTTGGQRFWRSLEELANSPEVAAWVAREFPTAAMTLVDGLSRRRFLTLMGASLALAGVTGCSVEPAPEEDIVPYVRPPELITPGRPLFFATTMTLGGDAVGLLVESHMGRPTKVEGNPTHPASRGATNVFHQASVLSLYDPDRSQSVTYLGQPRTWEAAQAAMRSAFRIQQERQGRGLRILTPPILSPTLAGQLNDLRSRLPEARWCAFDPLDRQASYAGARLAFDREVAAVYDLSQADVIVSLDADFLNALPGSLRYARDFSDRRRVPTVTVGATAATMNRLYVVEAAVSCTGAKADHRLALRSSQIPAFAARLAARLGLGAVDTLADEHDQWLSAVANDLAAHRGRSLVIAGSRQPPAVHLLAHVFNDHLQNVGATVRYIEPVELRDTEHSYSLADLAAEMHRGEAELLMILGGNPAYAAPGDLAFAEALEKVPFRMHLGLYQDETARLCHWHLPETHYLEAWSDARAYDGTASLVQPLVKPLYQGRSAHEVLTMLSELRMVAGQEIVKRHWRQTWSDLTTTSAFERRWQTALHDGVIEDSTFEPQAVKLTGAWQRRLDEALGERQSTPPAGELELNLLADPTLHDGSFANNGWLQELPKPVTLLTWGNAAIVSPTTAERLGLKLGKYVHGGQHGGHYMPVVDLTLNERRVQGPLWIMAGHADDTVTVYLGNGRPLAGRVGTRVGFDAYPLRTAAAPWFARGLQLADLGQTEIVACTQVHHSMDGRDLVRSSSLAEFHQRADLSPREHGEAEHEKFYGPLEDHAAAHQWGMAIDLTGCIGCNACVVACQAENNIPVVGKEQVAFGREMHWLRVDRYLEGPAESPAAFHFQPVPCMHCENAPCEYVCPVAATVHSADGLNDMVYNRCVGTRFCSNNCPYKVRRFNFLAYANFDSGVERLQFNPDVTVRSRGVMEKCTYCVQRIRQAEIDSQTEARPIREGEIITACQAACPTQAIVFGDINNPASAVRRWKDSPLSYGLLEELNTRPRTTYLAELRNPNPALEGNAT